MKFLIEKQKKMITLIYVDGCSGYGGATRSLYYSLKSLKNDRNEKVVIVYSGNAYANKFRELGCKVIEVHQMPKYRPTRRKNSLALIRFLWQYKETVKIYFALKKCVSGNSLVIHSNHENTAFFSKSLSVLLRAKVICHIRSTLGLTVFGKILYRFINAYFDYVIFINPQVSKNFRNVIGKKLRVSNKVITNPYEAETDSQDSTAVKANRDFVVVCMSSITYNRGIDRVVKVAEVLKEYSYIRFEIHGALRPTEKCPGTGVRYGQSIHQAATGLRNLSILGFTMDPEQIYRRSSALVKFDRDGTPWGRDILEAQSFGLPVVATGCVGAVSHKEDGFLLPVFSAEEAAYYIRWLATDATCYVNMSRAALKKSAANQALPNYAKFITRVYDELCQG